MRYLFIEPKAPGQHIFSRIPIPRLGNVLLATILARHGYECRVLVEEVRPVRTEDIAWADVVGISSTTTTAPAAYAWADLARAAGKIVVMGGPHVSFLADEALEHSDYVVRGEGDEAMLELAQALGGTRDPASIGGLSYRAAGAVRHNPSRPFLQDLDPLPTPDFSLVEGWSPRRVLPLSTSRGCPFQCRFCSVIPMFGTRYRFHSVGRVLDDLARAAASSRHVFVCDDNFAADKKRARAICQGMLDRGIRVQWSAQVRADCARDTELVDLMARAGCWYVYIGFESLNPHTLESFGKRQTVDDIRHAVEAFRGRGIRIHGMFVLGADQDDRRSIRETARFARRARIDSVQFLILTPTPGTPIHDEMAAAGRLLTRDWALYDAHHVVYEPLQLTPDELQREAERASARFYSLGSVLRGAARLDLFDMGLKLYAWGAARRLQRGKAPFLQNLRAGVLKGAQDLRQVLPARARLIALPTAGLPEGDRRFLVKFMTGLNIRPIEVPLAAERLWEHPAALAQRVDVVLLPLSNEPDGHFGGLQRFGWAWGARGEGHAFLGLPLHRDRLYRACIEAGLALGRSLRRVRRAYRRATGEG
ncbi:MAG: radical SAM protein [Deferrisomatales bacterium]|nr:radical SAM protein [Deferrisomatales bacterium]